MPVENKNSKKDKNNINMKNQNNEDEDDKKEKDNISNNDNINVNSINENKNDDENKNNDKNKNNDDKNKNDDENKNNDQNKNNDDKNKDDNGNNNKNEGEDQFFLSCLYDLFDGYDEILIKSGINKQYIINACITLEENKKIQFEIIYDKERDYFDYYPNNINFEFENDDEPFNNDLDIPKEDFCLLIKNFKKYKNK